MEPESRDRNSARLSLGQYLVSIRNDRKFTLRQVEDATNRAVSNAYLSQIETDKIQQPSPNILHALAELYKISYENLMERAGYITRPAALSTGRRHGRVAAFAEHNLTADEESELLSYLEHIRRRKRDRAPT